MASYEATVSVKSYPVSIIFKLLPLQNGPSIQLILTRVSVMTCLGCYVPPLLTSQVHPDVCVWICFALPFCQTFKLFCSLMISTRMVLETAVYLPFNQLMQLLDNGTLKFHVRMTVHP